MCSEFLMESGEEFSDDTSQAGMGSWAPMCALNNTPESNLSARHCNLFFDGFLGLHVNWQPFNFGLVAGTLSEQSVGKLRIINRSQLRTLVINLQFYFATLLSFWWRTSSVFKEIFWRPSHYMAFINFHIGTPINPNHRWGMTVLVSEVSVPNSLGRSC